MLVAHHWLFYGSWHAIIQNSCERPQNLFMLFFPPKFSEMMSNIQIIIMKALKKNPKGETIQKQLTMN